MDNDIFGNSMLKFSKLSGGTVGDNSESPYVYVSTLDALSEKAYEDALYKQKVISLVSERICGGWTPANIEPVLDDLEKKTLISKRPSSRSVARWKSQYDANKGLMSLVSKRIFKDIKINSNSADDSFFWDAVENRYLEKERPSISSAYRYYYNSILLHNEKNPNAIVKPITKDGFYKRIKKLPPYLVDSRRYGKQKADREYRVIGKSAQVTRVMERVEIDHTPLDLVLLDDSLSVPIGRPYLTILIDSYSGCVVGFYLSFQEPSYNSVRSAIVNACLDKKKVLLKYPSLERSWPCQGKIETLVVDNGAEFWSKSLDRLCVSLGMNVEINPVARPWRKPFVERFFGTFSEQFLHELPGTTFSNVKELCGYQPEKNAAIGFSLFLELMHQWIVDIYHHTPDARNTRIPAISWEFACKAAPPATYSELEEERFKIEAFPYHVGALTRTGIQIDNLKYTSQELVEYRKNTPPAPGNKRVEVTVKRDPLDVSYVYVYLENKDCFLKVPEASGNSSYVGVSIFQHQVHNRIHRNFIKMNYDKVGVAVSQKILDDKKTEAIEKAKSSKKLKGAKKLAAYEGISSDKSTSIMSENKKLLSDEIDEITKRNDSADGVSGLEGWDDIIDDLEPY